MIRLLKAAFTVALVLPATALARDNEKLANFKDAIVEDCDRAIASFDPSIEEDHGDLVSYLMEVLHLQLSGSSEAIAMVPQPVPGRTGMDGNPMARMDIWRSFDPNFELQAKSCALRVLKRLGADSVEALGALVGLARERTLPDEFRAALEETTLSIADLVDKRYPSAEVITEIAAEIQPDARNQTLARIVLERLGAKALPSIFAVMIERSDCARDKIRSVLRKLDPRYEQIPALMRASLASSDTKQRHAAIEAIPDFAGFYCGKISEAVALMERDEDRLIAESMLVKLNSRVSGSADKDSCQTKIVPKSGCDPKEKAALAKIVALIPGTSLVSEAYAGLLNSPAMRLCVGIDEIRILAKDQRPATQAQLVKVIAEQIDSGRAGKNLDEHIKVLLYQAASTSGPARQEVLKILLDKNVKVKTAVIKAKKDPAFANQQELLAYILTTRGEGGKADKTLAEKFVP